MTRSTHFRLHHCRPRFKNQFEEVLLYVAQSISDLGPLEESEFNRRLDDQIRLFPGNLQKSAKTIANWRTEISALFSMMRTDEGITRPTATATRLAESQDLIEFFRFFLFRFQYPGGHVKAHEAAEMIGRGVRFLPAQFLIQVLIAGQELREDGFPFGISPAEATHLIFNDLRVTASTEIAPRQVATTILDNRKRWTRYDRDGDVVRYAKDLLDYMVYADLATYRPATDTYSLNPLSIAASIAIAEHSGLFTGYDHLYGSVPSSREVAECELEWVDFASAVENAPDLAGGLDEILAISADSSTKAVDTILLQGIANALQGNANDIGRIGEAVAIAHEQNRLNALGRRDLAPRVVKIPERFGVGYDLNSFEGTQEQSVDTPRLVEVKTTRSRSRRLFMSFKMTPNEWAVARNSLNYFVYRILLSPEGPSLFVIPNPFQKYVDGDLAMVPRDGAEITYTEDAGAWQDLLLESVNT